jgi:hypothetical protein
MFRLVRKDDEKEDSNFPPTLHAAMELFGRVEMMAQALTCKKHVDVFLQVGRRRRRRRRKKGLQCSGGGGVVVGGKCVVCVGGESVK